MAKKSVTKRKHWPGLKLTKQQQRIFDTYPLVQVIWEDAHNIPTGWQYKEEYTRWKDSGVGIVSTIGHLLEKTAKHIIIGSMVSHDGSIGQVIKIPKTWCKIRILK